MPDQHTYLIQLRGSVDVDELNALTPLWVTQVRTEATTTRVAASTDQAGLIGLLRHLHGLGFQFLSIKCESPHRENGHVEIKTDAAG
ncbi:MAG: hypothetical protein HY870_04395 [Chloroflexi bacterium]|nr:hypothetical protein [Chloroflexota bacterium]